VRNLILNFTLVICSRSIPVKFQGFTLFNADVHLNFTLKFKEHIMCRLRSPVS